MFCVIITCTCRSRCSFYFTHSAAIFVTGLYKSRLLSSRIARSLAHCPICCSSLIIRSYWYFTGKKLPFLQWEGLNVNPAEPRKTNSKSCCSAERKARLLHLNHLVALFTSSEYESESDVCVLETDVLFSLLYLHPDYVVTVPLWNRFHAYFQWYAFRTVSLSLALVMNNVHYNVWWFIFVPRVPHPI